MERETIMRRYRSRVRYRNAAPWLKPWINPLRFFSNQGRKLAMKFETPATSEVDTFHCGRMKVVDGEWVSEEIAGYGVYEPALTFGFLKLVGENDVVVDIGMHLGYYATLFAELVGPGGQVHAFEPTPTTRALAKANVERYPQIRVWHEAMWSDDGLLVLRDYGLKWMAFNGTLPPKVTGEMPKPLEIKVNCLTVDMFSERIGRKIALIKIDAESAELEILKGAVKVLKRDRPLLSMEVGDGEDEQASRGALDFALSQGYEPWEIRDERLVRHEARDRYAYGNLILAPKGWEPGW